MCVFNEYNKLAIVRTECFYYKFFDGLMREDHPQTAVNFLFFVQDEIKPQRPILTTNVLFNEFLSYQEQRLEKIREFEKRLGTSSKEKRGEILEEEKKLVRQVINHSLLRLKYYDDTFRQIKPLPSGQPEEPIKIYSDTLLSAVTKYWHAAQEKNEIRSIFDQYAEEFLQIESYEKKMEKCRYYQGFYFDSIGKWKFSINDKNNKEIFSRESRIICLQQREENRYYPYKYMVLCIDFQMENGGASEDEAYKGLITAFNFYFKNIFNKGGDAKIFTQIFEKKSIWKDTFTELFAIGEKMKGVKQKDRTTPYNWNLVAGVSNG